MLVLGVCIPLSVHFLPEAKPSLKQQRAEVREQVGEVNAVPATAEHTMLTLSEEPPLKDKQSPENASVENGAVIPSVTYSKAEREAALQTIFGPAEERTPEVIAAHREARFYRYLRNVSQFEGLNSSQAPSVSVAERQSQVVTGEPSTKTPNGVTNPYTALRAELAAAPAPHNSPDAQSERENKFLRYVELARKSESLAGMK